MTKQTLYTHPLDDDGFIENFLIELTELSNRYGIIIETDEFAQLYLDVRVSENNWEKSYCTLEYNYENKKYE